jgi:hypothetical protein
MQGRNCSALMTPIIFAKEQSLAFLQASLLRVAEQSIEAGKLDRIICGELYHLSNEDIGYNNAVQVQASKIETFKQAS